MALGGANEGDPDAAASGATGAPDAVDVGLVVARRVEVDHVRDAVDVDPSRGHVGGDEGVHATGLEAGERLLALALGLVAVDRGRLDAMRVKALDEAIGAALGSHEHEGELALAGELLDERLHTLLVAYGEEPVLDRVLVAARLAVLVGDRAPRVARRQAAGDAVERGGEEQRLAVARAGRHDAIDGRAEAHVEHPVGLASQSHSSG